MSIGLHLDLCVCVCFALHMVFVVYCPIFVVAMKFVDDDDDDVVILVVNSSTMDCLRMGNTHLQSDNLCVY